MKENVVRLLRTVTGMLIDSERLKQAILTTMPERSEVLLIVDNQPDAVVRCKDCKYYWEGAHECTYLNQGSIKPDFFCGYGKQKEGDGD